jgi:hypothetical protein
MQTRLRRAAFVALLLALTGSAQAMDPSALEETNCLRACDANQENCLSAERASAPMSSPRGAHSSLPETTLSQRNRSLRTVKLAAPVK